MSGDPYLDPRTGTFRNRLGLTDRAALAAAEAVAGAIGSLRVDGLELDEFGAAVMQRVADGEIDEDEAIAIFLAQYRK